MCVSYNVGNFYIQPKLPYVKAHIKTYDHPFKDLYHFVMFNERIKLIQVYGSSILKRSKRLGGFTIIRQIANC